MPLLTEVKTFRTPAGAQDGIEITGYDGKVTTLEIPDTIEGLPVLGIGSHAFEGHTELLEIHLPKTLLTLRSFAFYRCLSLRRICLYDGCEDYYDGVIRQCPSLHEVEVRGEGKSYIIMREMLHDIDAALRFHLILPDREVRLTFPDFNNEAKEDTMARAIHFTIEGAGLAYRECVSKYAIDYAGYDKLLERLTDYDFRAGLDIALDRLMYPENLEEASKESYEVFLRAHSSQALSELIEDNDSERIAFMTREKIAEEAALEEAIRSASIKNHTEICGILMEYQKEFRKGPETFSLDDWD